MSFKFNGRGFLQNTGNIMPSNSINLSSGAIASGLNTISINGFSAQAINSPVSFQWTEPNVKKYEILESKQDLIALSVCWKRLRDANNATFISSMVDDSLFDAVNQDDINQAEKIRKHYLNKFTVLALKGIELSNYRKDLKELVNTDGKKFKETFMPLAYRLPEFYDYDIEFDCMLFEYNREVKNFRDSEPHRQPIMLTPVKEFIVNNKKGKRKEYWFSDSNGNLVSYYIEKSNPLVTLMDREFKKDLQITARLRKRERDGYEYIKMFDVDFG